jgi:lipopolysaccharide biosynthesis regulator YciM
MQRPDLRPIEHAHVLLCLGLDYKHGGFIDRALETFQEVVRLDPKNRYAFVNLQKLYEDQRQWADAAAVRETIASIDSGKQDANNQILGFLRNELGESAAAAGDEAAATRSFEAAIDTDARTAPAYLNLGDAHARAGQPAAAVEAWERLVQTLPDRAYLALDRLERAYQRAGTPRRFAELCERLINQHPQDWRTRLALSRHLASAGRHRNAFELLLAALPHNPHGLAIHQEVWKALLALNLESALVQEYMELTRGAVFYLDPHVCMHCRYRSTELLWQCPQCHEWNTFVEERMSTGKDAATAETG